MSAEEEMAWVDTRGIVTVVQYVKPIWNLTECLLIRPSMCTYWPVSN